MKGDCQIWEMYKMRVERGHKFVEVAEFRGDCQILKLYAMTVSRGHKFVAVIDQIWQLSKMTFEFVLMFVVGPPNNGGSGHAHNNVTEVYQI